MWNVDSFSTATRVAPAFKVAKQSFQVPMPHSPFLLNYLIYHPFFCKSQGKPKKSPFSHLGQGVCLCHGNGACKKKKRLKKWSLFIYKKIQP